MEQHVRRSGNLHFLLLATLCLCSVGCESAATRYEKHMANGRQELAQGGLQEAILSLKSALAARPEDVDARKLLVECYIERGAKEPARELLGPLVAELPEDSTIPLLDARLSLLEDDPDHALEILTGFMAVHGETAEALTVLGDAHAAKRLWSEALEAYDLALSNAPDNASALLGKASVLATLKRNTEAAEAAEHAIQADLHLGTAYLLRARLAQADGDLERARDVYAQALEQDPRVAMQARFGLGQVLLAQQKPKEALEQGEKLAKDYPAFPQGYYVRGVSHYLLGHYDDATADLQSCLSKAPDHPGAQFYLALAQYQRKQWQQALGAAKSLQAQFPGAKPVEMLIADLLLRTGDHKAAAAQARRVLAVVPDSSLMYRVLGAALIQGGDAEGGAQALEEAQRLAPDERLEFALGDLYLSMNELQKAADTFEAATAANPEDRGANVRLFFTRLRQGDSEGALGLLDDLLQKTPEDPMWLGLRGAAFLAKKDWQGAEAAFRKTIAVAPDLAEPRLNLARLYRRQARWEEARKEYEQVLALHPQDSAAHREIAQLDLREGKQADAITHLLTSLEAQPDPRVALQLATLRLRMGDVTGAHDAAEKATQLSPDLGEAWLALGIVALAQGDLKGSEVALRKASEQLPDSPQVWYHLAGLEIRRKNWQAARDDLKKAAAIAPGHPGVAARRVQVELSAGQPKAAEALAEGFLKVHPDLPTAYRLLAGVQEVLRQPDRARKTLASAQEKFGEGIAILLIQAEFERRQGNREEAVALYQRVLELDPKAAEVMFHKALVEVAAGNFEDAAASYEGVLALVPDHPVAINDLAYLYADVFDRPADALELLKRVAPEVLAKAPLMRDTLGWTQLKAGKTASAVDTLKQAAADLPGSGTVRYHLGAALIANGKTDDGRREIKAAIDLGLSPSEAEAARALLTEHTEHQRK